MGKKRQPGKPRELKGGIIASHGIALGKALVLAADTPYIPKYSIMKSQVPQELRRLEDAIAQAQAHIKKILADTDPELLRGNLAYLDAHLMMLSDPGLLGQIRADIQVELMNVETVFGNVVRKMIQKLEAIENEYLRERIDDLRDIHREVLGYLLGKKQEDLRVLDEDVVVVAHNLTPSQTASMDKARVKGFVTEIGGTTSHTAIFARALEIPAIVGLHDVTGVVEDGEYVILDANHGMVVVNPDPKHIKEYQTAKSVYERFIKKLSFLNELPAETTDKRRITLAANIEIPEEVDAVKAHGADGIGLFRSEFIFLDRKVPPTEDEQCKTYRDVLKRIGRQPVVIRTLDLGGDKFGSEHQAYHEANPFLGWRSIRFCLSRPEIFKAQLRALYRASVHGDLSIMFPMISGVDELLQAKRIVEQVKTDLRREGVPFREDVKLGIMIEVPSAVIVADELARHADFFSIGTNDLIQYSIAVDRGNERVAPLYRPLHPAVLRLIKMTIDAGARRGIPVEMCGEMAGDPMHSVLLVGMGLEHLSMSASVIPEVKKIVRSTDFAAARELADKVLKLEQTAQVEKCVVAWMREHFPSLIDKLT